MSFKLSKLFSKTQSRSIPLLNNASKRKQHIYDLHNLTDSPATTTELNKEDAFNFYRNMQLIRIMEKNVGSLYRKQKVVGFCHLYIGQEACAAGVKAVMRPQDTAIGTYRCHGWALMMGKDVGETLIRIFAELLGKRAGTSRGKGGSMHIYENNFYGGQAIVGSTIPLGTGIALAHKYKNDGGINFGILGDGAMNQGQVYESFNIAKLLNLPAIYLVENNWYGMGTPVKRSSANTDYYKRGDVIPGIRMDGNDVVVVREATKYAIEHVLADKGPILLEFLTYRYTGHSMSDPGTTYRDRDEIKKMRQEHDPIKKLSEKAIANGLTTAEELKQIKSEVKVMVKKAVKKAMELPFPETEELTSDVYQDFKGKIRMPQYGSYVEHKNMGSPDPIQK